jgi:hypothetical protein
MRQRIVNDASHSPVFEVGLSPLGQAALEWVRNRFAVFPCRPRGKDPLTLHGFKDATRDETQVSRWWTRSPNANIGLPTGKANGIMIVDLDGEEGERLLAKLEERHGKLPTTSRAKTSRGHHLYFGLPKDCAKVPSSNDAGIHIRADDGYAIAPPSVHLSGKTYEWDEQSPEDFVLAPQWLLDFARDRKAVLKALDGPTAAETASGGTVDRRRRSCPSPRESEWQSSGLSGRPCAGDRALDRKRGDAASIGAHKDPRRKPRHLAESRLRPA